MNQNNTIKEKFVLLWNLDIFEEGNVMNYYVIFQFDVTYTLIKIMANATRYE